MLFAALTIETNLDCSTGVGEAFSAGETTGMSALPTTAGALENIRPGCVAGETGAVVWRVPALAPETAVGLGSATEFNVGVNGVPAGYPSAPGPVTGLTTTAPVFGLTTVVVPVPVRAPLTSTGLGTASELTVGVTSVPAGSAGAVAAAVIGVAAAVGVAVDAAVIVTGTLVTGCAEARELLVVLSVAPSICGTLVVPAVDATTGALITGEATIARFVVELGSAPTTPKRAAPLPIGSSCEVMGEVDSYVP